MISLIVWH